MAVEEKVVFGPSAITKPTPQFAKNAFRIILYTLGIVNLALLAFAEIPQHVKGTIAQYSIEIAMFIHGISKMFGITIENDPTETKFWNDKDLRKDEGHIN